MKFKFASYWREISLAFEVVLIVWHSVPIAFHQVRAAKYAEIS